MRGLAVAALLVVVVAPQGSARAAGNDLDTRAAARAAWSDGTHRYHEKDYHAALEAYQRAYALRPDPAFLYNIAQCYRQLGDRDLAIRYYQLFANELAPGSNRRAVEALIGELRAGRLHRDEATPATETAPPPVAETPPAPPVAQLAPPPPTTKSEPPRPVWRRWWPWTILAVVVAAGAAVAIGVALSSGPSFDPTLPPIGPGASGAAWMLAF